MDEVVAYFAGLNIPVSDITYEIEEEYYGADSAEVVFRAYKTETDEEYESRVKDYEVRLAKWQTWHDANKEEIKIEESRRAQERKERKIKQRDKDEAKLLAQLEQLRKRRI